jgi:catechol 2,3-dioxygenase-like lactoylglutathione lyase family enzyme
MLSLGAQTLVLTGFPGAAPYPANGAANDTSFQHCAIVVDDMKAACDRVMRHGATPITRDGPQTLPPSTGSVTAFKFRDPDGHPLELIAFPDGTGDPTWQSAHTDGPTLGIDHSAISVADVDRSVPFYELLGLRVAARGVNRGVEQQRLDDLANVEVDVVALESAMRTPHLELLGYRQPHGRTNRPADLTDVTADRLAWQAENVDVLLEALSDGGFTHAIFASGFIDGTTVALLRDPDGHLLVLRDAS